MSAPRPRRPSPATLQRALPRRPPAAGLRHEGL